MLQVCAFLTATAVPTPKGGTYMLYDQQGERMGAGNFCGVDAPRLPSLDSRTVLGRSFAIAANTIINLL